MQHPEINKNIKMKIKEVPVVSIFGTGDKYISVESAKGSKDFVTNYKQILIDGAGHWVHMEKPNIVNEEMSNNLT